MIGDHVLDDLARAHAPAEPASRIGVRLLVRDQRLPERPAAPACPRWIVESEAASVADVVTEVAASTLSERGATRADDRISEAAMEDRKKEGYF